MCSPVSKILFALIVLMAVPVLGVGDRAQAGTITTGSESGAFESYIFGNDSVLVSCLSVGQSLLNDLVSYVAETVASLADGDSPLDRLLGLARRTLGGSAKSGMDATLASGTSPRVELGDSPIGLPDPAMHPLAVEFSSYRAKVSLHLPDPHLSSLFRPPC